MLKSVPFYKTRTKISNAESGRMQKQYNILWLT